MSGGGAPRAVPFFIHHVNKGDGVPALDDCHEQVVRALQKAGWNVQAKAYYLQIEDVIAVFPDIKAWLTNGSRQQIIVVEVKCFSDQAREQDELYRTIGQYLIYRSVLDLKQIRSKLYLAVPSHVYRRLFTNEVMTLTIQRAQIKLLIVDVDREEITQWLD